MIFFMTEKKFKERVDRRAETQALKVCNDYVGDMLDKRIDKEVADLTAEINQWKNQFEEAHNKWKVDHESWHLEFQKRQDSFDKNQERRYQAVKKQQEDHHKLLEGYLKTLTKAVEKLGATKSRSR